MSRRRRRRNDCGFACCMKENDHVNVLSLRHCSMQRDTHIRAKKLLLQTAEVELLRSGLFEKERAAGFSEVAGSSSDDNMRTSLCPSSMDQFNLFLILRMLPSVFSSPALLPNAEKNKSIHCERSSNSRCLKKLSGSMVKQASTKITRMHKFESNLNFERDKKAFH